MRCNIGKSQYVGLSRYGDKIIRESHDYKRHPKSQNDVGTTSTRWMLNLNVPMFEPTPDHVLPWFPYRTAQKKCQKCIPRRFLKYFRQHKIPKSHCLSTISQCTGNKVDGHCSVKLHYAKSRSIATVKGTSMK